MGSTFGRTLKTTVFGQSHSEAVGCVVEGFPSGFRINLDDLAAFMRRRSPGRNRFSTPRKEDDLPQFLGGLIDGNLTCGTPLAAIIANTNTRSSDYNGLRRVPRPGHADFTSWAKWDEARDVAGGGHFSARLTAPLCVAGGIALQYLAHAGVSVCAHVSQVGPILDEMFCIRDNTPRGNARLMEQIGQVRNSAATSFFATISPTAGRQMELIVDEVRQKGDSVGGAIECVAIGMPAGIGGPRYEGIQSQIAQLAFGIPAVRALEFGAGFEVASMRGSDNNDPYGIVDGTIRPLTNNAGGTIGGITTGAPISFRLAVKPTPSISLEQQTVDLKTMQDTTLAVRGRHDPCVAVRAVPIVEAVMALALLDSWLSFPSERDSVWRNE